METKKNHREEPSHRRGQETAPNSRNQAPRPRPRPQEAPQASPGQRPGAEGTAARPKQRPNPEAAPKAPPAKDSARQPSPAQARSPRQGGAPARSREGQPVSRQAGEPKKAPAKAPRPSAKRPATASKAPAKPRKASRPKEQPDDLSSKKRAYGNSKPKKKSTFSVLGQAISATAKESAAKRRARQERQGKRSRRESGEPMPAVIYTQPQAFNRDRLLVQLITVTAVVVAFVVGISVFFKVRHIRVSGADVYTAWAVEEASGIKEGDNLLTFSRARAGALIKANLPYVNNVSFGIKLPDTVNIIIEEEDVVYAIKDQDEQWWLINSSGRVVEQAKKGAASNYTQIVGVALDHPLKDQEAMAVETRTVVQDPDPTAETTEPVVVPTVTGAQRLSVALQIVQALEDNDIVGNAASINVSQLQGITLWYGTRYQVNLGDEANLEYKIACMNSVIMNMQEYQSGVLDCSFTVWPDQVGYTPFS